MKIGILSLYHKNHNYGGQLQAYALCEYLNALKNVDAEQINFAYKKRLHPWSRAFLCRTALKVLHPMVQANLRRRKQRFCAFENAIPHSIVLNANALPAASEQYDFVFAGSDQVWNLSYSVPAFFLGFLPPEKRCSCAASFGKDVLTQEEYKFLPILREYRFLSVREESAKKFLEENGVNNVRILCDPTLLLPQDFWKEKIEFVDPLVQGKYIFVYLLGENAALRKEIRRKSSKTGLPIVLIPHIHGVYQKCDVGFADCEPYEVGPREFLRLIYDAEFVITDSFHCTVFSLLFEKEFWTLPRSSKTTAPTNNRVETLLKVAHVENRFVPTADQIDFSAKIDSQKYMEYLEQYSQLSQKTISEFIQQNQPYEDE